jgi:8-oxo-dGTP pyrophosphatase MutT (NUDIX family)
MARDPIPTFCFALVLVKVGRRFVLVKERKHGEGWYFPAGRVERGETFAQAALRETKEEAGIDVVLEGVIRIEHRPTVEGMRLRVFFLARPSDDAALKSTPDEHSLEARLFAVDELKGLPLRGDEVEEWMRYVLDGPVIAPLSLISIEGV